MIGAWVWTCLALSQLPQAEDAFHAGRYVEAMTLYEEALNEPSLPRGPLLFNLGLAASRAGRHPQALLSLRRAARWMPENEELATLLQRTEEALGVDPTLPVAPGATGLAWVVAVQSVALLGLVLSRRPALRVACAAALVSTVPSAAQLVAAHWLPAPRLAVVLEEEVLLRPEPHLSFAPQLPLRAGETVRVSQHSDRWARVLHPRGEGWTERAGIGLLLP